MMNDSTLALIAKNAITGFLLSLGIVPSEGEDTLEIRDYGPHRVFTQQAKVPENMSASIDARETYQKLVAYIEHHNALPTATLIEKILVHEATKDADGNRTQEIEIVYRFVGKID